MPWTDLKTRRWPAFDKDLDGISKQTMDDHFKLYEGYAKKANECRRLLNEFEYSDIEGNQVHVNRQLAQAEAAKEGADSIQAHERVPVG